MLNSLLMFLFQASSSTPSSSSDPVLGKIWGVLIAVVVGQIVVGAFFMIGFVAVVRKSIDKDIPAQLQSLDKHFQELARELLQMRREVDKHGYKIEALEKSRDTMQGDLDDTRSRRPASPRR
jgi:hypothetical protein